ncbi:MAG: DUF4407 domain-containing protein [Bacteroidales bacterium]|nr:DUF4407 domain-containing protein [Bacteroidales bacterium]
MNKDIYIAYRRKQEPALARLACKNLEDDGYSVYLDVTAPPRGGYVQKEIEEKVQECTDFIIIVDSNTFKRDAEKSGIDYLRMELMNAYHKEKNIIPLLNGIEKINEEDLPSECSFLSKLKACVYNENYSDGSFKRLKGFLKSAPKSKKRAKNKQKQDQPTNEYTNEDVTEDTNEDVTDDYQRNKYTTGPSYESYGFEKQPLNWFGKKARKIREFFWYVAGADIDILRLCTSCYGTYAVIGTLICLTSTLALLTGGYAIYSITRDEWYAALATIFFAPVYAYLIFSIDRSFVVGDSLSMPKTPSGWFIMFGKVITRLFLALVIGLIISAPIELMVFHGQIDIEVAKNLENDAQELKQHIIEEENKINNEISDIKKDKQSYEEKAEARHQEAAKEQTRTSKKYPDGRGPEFIKIKNEETELRNSAKKCEDDIIEKQERLRILNQQKLQLEQKAATEFRGKNDFITRYKAFSKIIDKRIENGKNDSDKKNENGENDSDKKNENGEHNSMWYVAWAIRILFIMFEIAPIISKLLLSLSEANQYEKLIKEIEDEKNKNYKNAMIGIFDRMFGDDFKKYSKGKFEPLSGFMEEEYRKSQLVYKREDDLNHFSRDYGYN